MESKHIAARCPDYQFYSFDADGFVCNPGERMTKKLQAIPLPDLAGKKVLDVGCDFGFWTFLAANKGASRVLGLDRGRPVRGEYFDVITSNREEALKYPCYRNVYFEPINIGKQWMEFGTFDVIFMFSLYHHIFENCGDHAPIWYWLFRQCAHDGVIVWENPVDVTDGVAHANISKDKHALYTKEAILSAAGVYFDIEYKGPALHEPTRHVYYFRPKQSAILGGWTHIGKIESGAGGATKAFEYESHRRCREISSALGFVPVSGSLNVRLEHAFDWTRGYYRMNLLDVVERSKGFDSVWDERPARFYPVMVNGWPAFLMRFEGESYYNENFVEIIASVRLRDSIKGEKVKIERL